MTSIQARQLRAILHSTAALGFCAFLAACDNGDGGSAPKLVSFTMSNYGECQYMYMTVDVGGPGTELARLDDQTPDCSLNDELVTLGCEATFTEANGPGTLIATIDKCTVPAHAVLFECAFQRPDISAIDDATLAMCSCQNGYPFCFPDTDCLRHPTLCVSDRRDQGCERCFNGADDDGDGKTDCEDSYCDAECGVLQTSSTCEATGTTHPYTSSSTTTTSTSSTTTSTLPVEGVEVRFRLDSATAAVGAVQWTVDYSSAPGSFIGKGGDVECTSTISGLLASANDDDEGSLQLAVISLSGVVPPADLMTCSFQATGQLSADDFHVSVDDASDVNVAPIDVSISVQIPAAP